MMDVHPGGFIPVRCTYEEHGLNTTSVSCILHRLCQEIRSDANFCLYQRDSLSKAA